MSRSAPAQSLTECIVCDGVEFRQARDTGDAPSFARPVGSPRRDNASRETCCIADYLKAADVRINTMTTMPDKRQADGAETREKIDGYLTRSGLASRSPRVVPLTGDASDRRYFRVLLPDSGSIVLSLHAAPFRVRHAPVRQRRAAAGRDAGPDSRGARSCRRSRRSGARGSGRRDASGASRRRELGRARGLYRQAVALIATLQRRGAELASPEYIPYGVAFDVEKLTWELDFFIKHFIEAYRGRGDRAAGEETNCVGSSRSSSRRWPPSRACCAIAITTAAT